MTVEFSQENFKRTRTLLKHAGMLFVMDEFLKAQWSSITVMFGLIAYGALLQFLGIVYDNEWCQMFGYYCFGGVFGIAFSNHIRYRVANRLFKKMDEEMEI